MTKADIQTQLERSIDPATVFGTPAEVLETCAYIAVNGEADLAFRHIEDHVAYMNDLDQVRQYINRASRDAASLEQVPA